MEYSKTYEDKILDNLEPEDLSDDMKLLCDMFGFTTTKEIMKLLGGTRLHIPMPTTYSVKALIRYLEKNKGNELSINKTARDFSLSTDTVSKYVREVMNERLF